ncbi:leucine-rich repeat domain-containing protein [Treponema socranskii]|uniref:leucine-rich repeat domain-containing protein n=1 Tax=Treponema socranskii TaxID=53419 RepID=UPI0023F43C76|nr:leucine-rich repeat domain-containing protein [Treponema socranskii]
MKIENGVLKGGQTPSGTLVIPADVTEIARKAFKNRTDLQAVDFSSCTRLIKIGAEAFFGCTGLKNLRLPASLKTLEYSVFFGCTGINGTVVLPANLETIGDGAFYLCSNVDGFDFSKCTKLSSIGSITFAKCTKITKMNLPASLTSIAGDAFNNCPELTELTVHSDNKSLKSKNNIIYTYDERQALCCARTIPSVDFPPSLTQIADWAFKYCKRLKELKLPDNVETLGFQAFYGCDGIMGTVHLPKNLKTIGIGAFDGCSNVAGFDLSKCNELSSIGGRAFANCMKIKEVHLPEKLEEIVGNAFSGCTELATITVDSANASFTVKDNTVYDKGGKKLLCSARAITSFNFPADITEIGRGAFSGCEKLTAANLSSCTALKTIAADAFFGCASLKQLILPASLETLEDEAFFTCREMSGTVVLPANLKKIGEDAFFQCGKVTVFDFSKCTDLISIAGGAFTECNAAAFTVKKGSVGSAIKAALIKSGVAESQISEVD